MANVSIVSGCADCPLCAETVVSWGYEQSQNQCQHPDAKYRGVAKVDKLAPAKAPRWCPLRIGALTVQLTSEAQLQYRRKAAPAPAAHPVPCEKCGGWTNGSQPSCICVAEPALDASEDAQEESK